MGWTEWLRWWRVLRRPGGSRPLEPSATDTTQDFPIVPSLSLSSESLGYELRVGVISTVGNVREHNEDNFYVPGRPSAHAAAGSVPKGNGQSGGELGSWELWEGQAGPSLFIVADGMGGQLAGEKASEMAVELIPAVLGKRLGVEDDEKSVRRTLRESIAEVNKEILAQSQLVTEFCNMGTTVVLTLFRGDRAFVTGIGDSRVYRLRSGHIERLTTDHSLAEALVGAGTIRPEEAENHKFRHVLYNYLGCKDARDGPDEIRVVDVRAGDRFLLATDGLTGVVRDEVIAQLMTTWEDPQRAAQALVNRALENRSKDNITCLVIQVH